MTMTINELLACTDGASDDKVVELIRAIHALKGQKTGCGKCGCTPCGCHKPAPCHGCGCAPCSCDPCRPNIGDYLLELGKLNLCFYEQLFEVNQRFHRTLADALCIPTPPSCNPCGGCGVSPCCCTKKAQEVQKTLCLEGESDQKAVGTFSLTNAARADREVSFLTGEFRGEGKGASRFTPQLHFDLLDADGAVLPDRVLAKGATGTVAIVVPLVDGFAAPGAYHGTVIVKSHTTLHLNVCVEVTAPAGKATGGKGGAKAS